EQCLNEGLLIVGSGPGGDPIVIDLREELVAGFVCMEEMSGYEDDEEPARRLFAASPFDLGTFFLAAAEHAYDPDRSHRHMPASAGAGHRQTWLERFVIPADADLPRPSSATSCALDAKAAAFLDARGVQPELRAFFERHSFSADVDIEVYRFYKVNDL